MRNVPLLAVLAVLSFSCVTNSDPGGVWREGMVKAPSDRVVWQLSLNALHKMGFPKKGGVDPNSGEIETGWKTQLHPFQGEGIRERAEVKIDPVEPGKWRVRTRVARQTNESLVNPLDLSRAEWKWTNDHPDQAEILLMHIQAFLPPEFELAEENKKDPLDALMEKLEELEE